MNIDLVSATDRSQGEGEAAQAASPAHGIYATWAPKYREAGFWPLPITPGTKICNVASWQNGMSDQDFQQSLRSSAFHGIGLLLGSKFSDGTVLNAVDVDDERYIKIVAALLGEPTCARVGSKGIGAFVRSRGPVSTSRYRSSGQKPHVEFLGPKAYIVIPPTIHKVTQQPYRWLTTTLLEIDYRQLPLIEA